MTDSDMPTPVSTFFFPLRTNVGFFDAPENYLSLTERIKQASLLYDRLFFESGIYIATFLPTGQHESYIPAGEIGDGLLDSLRQGFRPTGGESLFIMQMEGQEPIALPSLSGPVERRFHSEFHSVLRDLNAEDLPWIDFEAIELTDSGKKYVTQIERALKKDFDAALPEAGRYLRKKVLANFSRDIMIAQDMSAAASMHALYSPILASGMGAHTAPGFTALQVTIPNLTNLHWEEILELREQEALVEFRRKLLEVEQAVQAAMENQIMDDIQYQLSIAQKFNQELKKQLAEYHPKKWEAVGNVIFDFLISLIPIPMLSTFMTGLREGVKVSDANRTWVAAFLRLAGDD